jgi:two-component system, cell cycle sensor histidine kinase and response regulator CckA
MSTAAEQNSRWVTKRVREALAAGSNTELLKALVEAFPGSWFFTRLNASFAYVNQNACDSLGYTRDELMALTLYDVDVNLTREIWNGLLAKGPFNPTSVRTAHRRRDGSTFPVEAYGSRLVLGEENVAVSYVVDLSDEAQARRELAENQHLLKSVLDNAPVIVWQVDRDGRFELAEGSAMSLLGLEPGPVVGRTVSELFPDVPQMIKATERVLQGHAVEDVVSGRQHEFEYRYVPRRDATGAVSGATGVAMDVTARRNAERTNHRLMSAMEQAEESVLLLDANGRIEYANAVFEAMSGIPKEQAPGRLWPALPPASPAEDGARKEIGLALAAGTGWRGTLRCERRHPGPERDECIQHASLSPLRDTEGKLTGFVAVSRDVTEQIRTEERLRQIEKMDAVGQLAGGVAHDFNNLLQVIMGNAGLCQRLGAPEALRGPLREIAEAGKRAAGLVSQLLTLSRNVGKPKSIDLGGLVDRILPLLRRLLGEHIIIEFQPVAIALEVWGDESQLEQVIVNLCVNARDAMPEGGRLQLQLSRYAVDASDLGRLGLAAAATYVAIEVTDTGCGMSEEVQRRVFEPFYTTKAPGLGTGLGLATVYGVAKRHGGAVEVHSQVGKGSCFRVLLRSSDQRGDLSGSQTQQVPDDGRRLRVLLAEDDDAVREITRRFLVQAGHDVVVARNGTEAVRLFAKDETGFDLLVVDAIMPGVNGPEVYRAFRVVSTAPVLFVTGHDFNVLASLPASSSASPWAILRKPFSAEEISAAVGKLVGG